MRNEKFDITMIGHASILIETTDCTILMDPILRDPHQRDIFSVSPQRTIDNNKIPNIDVIIISHRHFDHFDVKSLSMLNKDAEVIFPTDPLIDNTLDKLGYKVRIQLDDWTSIKYGDTSLTTTPSLCPVPEFGIVIKKYGITYWNQVDTIVSNEITSIVENKFGKINIIQCPWQPMLETSYLWGESISFPFSEYQNIIDRTVKLSTNIIIPGANGFRYVGESEWLNRVVFPLTREKFKKDMIACDRFKGEIEFLDPGERMEVNESGEVKKNRDNDFFVNTVNTDQSDLYFSPNSHHFLRHISSKKGKERCHILNEIKSDLNRSISAFEKFHIDKYKYWEVVFELNINFKGESVSWSLDFSEKPPCFIDGKSSMANIRAHINKLSLIGLHNETDSWVNIIPSGEYALVNMVYKIINNKVETPIKGEIKDPLWLIYSHDKGMNSYINNEIKTLNKK